MVTYSRTQVLYHWTDLDDLYIVRRVSTFGCILGGCVDTAPHLGGQIALKNPMLGRE